MIVKQIRSVTIILLMVGFYQIISFLLSKFGLSQSFFFPSVGKMYNLMKQMFLFQDFYIDVMYSLLRVITAFLISRLIVLLVGFLVINSKKIHSIVGYFTSLTRYLPIESTLPLIILVLGIGEVSKIGLLVIGTSLPLIGNLQTEVLHIPIELKDLVRTVGVSKIRGSLLFLRSILPKIYDNSRIILGLCRGYIVIAEMIASQEGIGYTIWTAQKYANIGKIYICIITLVLLGFFCDFTLMYLRKKIFPYLYQ